MLLWPRPCWKFQDVFADKIEAFRAGVVADIPHPSLERSCGDTVYELVNFRPVSRKKVSELTSSKVKSCELDPVSAAVLKPCLSVLKPIITEIVNCSLAAGSVPQCLKITQIRLLLKKCNLESVKYKNFRPVSNLPFISKAIEKAVCFNVPN